MKKENIGSALHEYEGQIWGTADTLYSSGFKASDWPKYMMPFFALMLVESRILRVKAEKIKEIEQEFNVQFDPTNEEHIEMIDESIKCEKYGYHEELVKHGRTLATITETQPSNFYSRLMDYLNFYDVETKKLLGISYDTGTSKHLDIKGVIDSLNAKNQNKVDVLYNFTKKWAKIDLTIFNNSEVTTIEEHIKHRWADISAETAGEHYTPFDIIQLCTDINVAIAPIDPKGIWDVYDMTCGGGNFVFGLEDALRETYPELSVCSYGQEYNDQLYALASIESRFRPDARIEYGNTLTNDRFQGTQFGSVIGNPPYGTEWKDFEKSVRADQSGRFSSERMPSVGDSQMLFLQHAVSHMKENGVGTIVHNGSPLTSGDAGSGESNIRKYLIKELDVVQAIIQLPQNLFFNTGISTYIWVLNKNKPLHLKDKVIILNAEDLFVKMKKSLNKKSSMVDEQERKQIVSLLLNAEQSELCKIVSTDSLMYNKVEIQLTRSDENGVKVEDKIEIDKNGKEKIIPNKIRDVSLIITTQKNEEYKELDLIDLESAVSFNTENDIVLSSLDLASAKITISASTSIGVKTKSGDHYIYNKENEIVYKNGVSLGRGILEVKVSKSKKMADNELKFEVLISPLKEKDVEITPYSSDVKENEKMISEYLNQWITDEVSILNVKEGCEINMNKAFPKKYDIKTTSQIKEEIKLNDQEFGSV